MNFGLGIKRLRNKNKVTQVDLAKRIKITQAALSRIEIGDVQLRRHNLEKCLQFFGATETEFLIMCIDNPVTDTEKEMMLELINQQTT